jgi:hypothetical protein
MKASSVELVVVRDVICVLDRLRNFLPQQSILKPNKAGGVLHALSLIGITQHWIKMHDEFAGFRTTHTSRYL